MHSYINLPEFNPVMLELPGALSVSWYGFMYFCGFLFTFLFVRSHIKRKKIVMRSDEFSNILSMIFLGVLAGGRLGFCLFVNPGYYLRNPLKIFAIWEGGMYFFGGLIAALLLPCLVIRKMPHNYFDIADLVIIPAPMALAFGRLGNFINGEFWGKPTKRPWGMIFSTTPNENRFDPSVDWVSEWIQEMGLEIPSGSLANLPRHPVQLYELILEGIILFCILMLFSKKGKPKPRGSVISLFIMLYGLMRFWMEFYRHPTSHSALILGSSWFTLSMLFSVPMIVAGGIGLYWSFRKSIVNRIYGNPDKKKSSKKKKKR